MTSGRSIGLGFAPSGRRHPSVSEQFNKSYSLADRITYGAAQRRQSSLRVTVKSIDTIETQLSSAFAPGGALCLLWVISGHESGDAHLSAKRQAFRARLRSPSKALLPSQPSAHLRSVSRWKAGPKARSPCMDMQCRDRDAARERHRRPRM